MGWLVYLLACVSLILLACSALPKRIHNPTCKGDEIPCEHEDLRGGTK
jgi:hypothetical protein